MYAGRGPVVGDAAALRQPGRLYGAGALLLFSRGAEGLRRAQSRGAGALGVYGGVYTCIGVAHAMQGPRAKWRPRIVLLTAAFGLAAASHIAALPVAALLGLAAMLWVAEGRRSQVLPVVLMACSRGAGSCLCLLRLLAGRLQLRLPLRRGLSLVLARSGPTLLLRPAQRGHHRGRGGCPGALLGPAPLALLWELRSFDLRRDPRLL